MNNKQIKIGFSHFDPRFAFFWSIVSHCAKEEVERLEVTLISKPAPYVTDQIVGLQELLEQQVDALLLTPVESGHPELISVIEEFGAAGIPVVALDSEVGGGKVACTVRSDNIKGEELAAEQIFKQLGGQGKVAHFQGDLKVGVGALRSEGFHNALQRYPEIELVFEAEGDWYRETGAKLMRQVLAKQPDIQAVVAANDLTALGVSDAIAEAERTGEILVAGFDALPEALLAIHEGKMTTTIRQAAQSMAREALETAIQTLQGQTVPPLILTEVELISVDNLLQTTVDGLHMLPGVLRNLEEQKVELSKANIILEQEVVERQQAEKALGKERNLLRTLIDNLPDYIYVKDTESRFLMANLAVAQLMGGLSPNDLLGKNDADFYPAELAAQYQADEQSLMQAGEALINKEEPGVDPDGNEHWLLTNKIPLRDSQDRVTGLVGIGRDITEQKQAKAEQERLQQEVIKAQKRAIHELSTPVIPIMKRIIVMPLMGSIDSMRARAITRSLLAGIRENRAKVVILDITGVSVVDSGVANHLNKTIQAARLKGARTIVTGISDAVAETIVDLGIDWSGITTLSDLQTGLIVALSSIGFKLSQ